MKRAVILTLPILLSACATTTYASIPPQLAGTAWTFITIDGARPASSRASLRFEGNRVSAPAGCNGLGGTWRIDKGQLIGGPYVSTMMFCDGLMEQERALAALLEGKPAIHRDGSRLTLTSASHKAELIKTD